MSARFEARDVKPYAAYVAPANLKIGEVYFYVAFLDAAAAVPSLVPLAFIGRDLEQDEHPTLYFQDAVSFFAGVVPAFGSKQPSDDQEEMNVPTIYSFPADSGHVMTFDEALNVLLYCSLTRDRAGVG